MFGTLSVRDHGNAPRERLLNVALTLLHASGDCARIFTDAHDSHGNKEGSTPGEIAMFVHASHVRQVVFKSSEVVIETR